MLFDGPLKEFNEIQFTMKFWQKNAEMACHFNHFLDKRLLLQEVFLEPEYFLAAAVVIISGTFLALATEVCFVKISLFQNFFNPLQLSWIFRVVRREHHFLNDSCAISHELSVMHPHLFSTWVNIHARDNKSVLFICHMTL